MKLRESDFDTAIREFQITSHGIRVCSTFTSAEAVLSGYARQLGSFSELPAARFRTAGRGRS